MCTPSPYVKESWRSTSTGLDGGGFGRDEGWPERRPECPAGDAPTAAAPPAGSSASRASMRGAAAPRTRRTEGAAASGTDAPLAGGSGKGPRARRGGPESECSRSHRRGDRRAATRRPASCAAPVPSRAARAHRGIRGPERPRAAAGDARGAGSGRPRRVGPRTATAERNPGQTGRACGQTSPSARSARGKQIKWVTADSPGGSQWRRWWSAPVGSGWAMMAPEIHTSSSASSAPATDRHVQRDQAEGPQVVLAAQTVLQPRGEVVAEDRAHAEQEQSTNAEEERPAAPLLASDQLRRDGRRVLHRSPCPSSSLRRTRSASSASRSGPLSASTSTNDAVTASGPNERIPSTTRREACARNSASSMHAS